MSSPTRWEIFWRTVMGRAYPRVVGAQRERSWLFFETLLPLLQVSAFVFVYRAIQAPPEFTGFVVLGGAMTAYWLNVLWSMAAQFYWEKETGNLELYIIAPTSLMAILLGMAIGGIVFSTMRALAVMAVGLLVFRVEVLHPERFPTGQKLAAYLGLAPWVGQSGESRRDGPVMKAGNKRVRRQLVEASWQWKRRDPKAQAVYRRLVANTGSSKKAITAMARRLGIRLWRLATQPEPQC